MPQSKTWRFEPIQGKHRKKILQDKDGGIDLTKIPIVQRKEARLGICISN